MTTERETLAEVWLCQELDSLRRMHGIIELYDARASNPSRLFEVGNWQAAGPIDVMLNVCRFVPATRFTLDVVEMQPEEVDCVRVTGFTVADERMGDVLSAIETGFSGNDNGFASVVVAVQGFHQSPYVFELLWRMAGSPAVRLCTPQPISSRSGAVPAEIDVLLDRVCGSLVQKRRIPQFVQQAVDRQL